MVIDCDRCEARGLACGNCAATVIVGDAGEQPDLGPAELRALTVLANAGLIPPAAVRATHGQGFLTRESGSRNQNVIIIRSPHKAMADPLMSGLEFRPVAAL